MAFCTRSDLVEVMTEEGIIKASSDDDLPESANNVRIAQTILRAKSIVMQYLTSRYDEAELDGNTWIKWCTATVAAVILYRRRGGTPNGIADDYDNFIAHLVTVRDGVGLIPDASPRHEPGATMSNMHYDERYSRTKLRVEKYNSAGEQRSLKPRFTDQHPYGGIL